ncbi:MAG: hypothetical protein E6593_08520 [Clostridium sp.]|nr:hypothetical protein [Clostridium sp.]
MTLPDAILAETDETLDLINKAKSLLAKRELWGFHSSLFVCGLDGSLLIVELAAAAAAIIVAATIAASAASAIAPATAAKQNED